MLTQASTASTRSQKKPSGNGALQVLDFKVAPVHTEPPYYSLKSRVFLCGNLLGLGFRV